MSMKDDIILYCARKGYSISYTNYWVNHPFCEARTSRMAAAPHHIRTRGAGGDDNASNLLALCIEKHREIHNIGDQEFAISHPWLAKKIKAALAARR